MKKVPNYIDRNVNASYFARMFYPVKTKLRCAVPFLVLFLINYVANAQELATKQASWQQEVNYTIEVRLNDIDHMLTGHIDMIYVNNSPDALDHIMMHLWPNAYKNLNTAFAKQQLGNGSTSFYFAGEDERGWIDSLDFTVNGSKAEWHLDAEHIDIARINLTEALAPGDSLVISTPFKVKIPGSFSRFGHEKNGYQISQWFPKPAVYDVNGWNPMPYLDQGEFYSEYGFFHVEITVPMDYVVAATGVLQDKEEWEFLGRRENKPLSEKAQAEKREYKTSETFKTLTFEQGNVHDFAWFADPTFNLTSEKIQLPSGDSVTIMVFTTDPTDYDLAKDHITHAKQTLLYYSQNIGNYPYRYCSVVQGALTAGGGMEYPMVTVIPNLMETVIVHEVGHNWFYGILGNNERIYPWMDEAINSYYEHRTIQNYANTARVEEDPLAALNVMKEARNIEGFMNKTLTRDLERRWQHQPISLPAVEYASSNYGLIIYGKGASAFQYLEEYLGHRTLDKGMKSFFTKWKFRHPLPGDLQAELEDASGKDLSWFFNDYLVSDGILDYSLEFVNKITGKALIRNNGDIVAPFPLCYILDDKIVRTIWIEGFEGEKEVDLLNVEYDALKIDAEVVMTETYTTNNTYRVNARYPTIEPLKRNKFFTLEDPNRTQMTLNLASGWNLYDEFMIGLIMSNIRVPRQNLEFVITPMYGFGSSEITGYGDIRYTRFYKDAKISSTQIGLGISQFSHELAGIYNDLFTYFRVAPFVTLNFAKPSARSKIKRSITLEGTWMSFSPFESEGEKLGEIERSDPSRQSSFLTPDPRTFISLDYELRNERALNPYGYKLRLLSGMASNTTTWLDSSRTTNEEFFTRLELTVNYKITYNDREDGLDIRFFGGNFIQKAKSSAFQFAYNNTNTEVAQPDLMYSYSQMGRGATYGLFNHQLIEGGPFLKNVGLITMADKWIAAVNLETDLPFKIPLRLYLDVFTSNNIQDHPYNDDEMKYGYSGGAEVRVIDEFISIYIPFIQSPFIDEAQSFRGMDKFAERITFTLNLNLFNPFTIRSKVLDLF